MMEISTPKTYGSSDGSLWPTTSLGEEWVVSGTSIFRVTPPRVHSAPRSLSPVPRRILGERWLAAGCRRLKIKVSGVTGVLSEFESTVRYGRVATRVRALAGESYTLLWSVTTYRIRDRHGGGTIFRMGTSRDSDCHEELLGRINTRVKRRNPFVPQCSSSSGKTRQRRMDQYPQCSSNISHCSSRMLSSSSSPPT